MRKRLGLGVALIVLMAVPLVAQPAAVARTEAGGLSVESRIDFDRAVLTVAGPDGFHHRRVFGPGEAVTFFAGDTDEGTLADGGYQYQVSLIQAKGAGFDDPTAVAPDVVRSLAGSFSIVGGVMYESTPDALGGGVVADEDAGSAVETYFADDLQVAGDLGLGHTNGQNPDKEIDIENISELFIRFDDTGAATTTWDIGVPSGSFSWVVKHVDASPTTPFKILDNATDNSLVIAGSGDVGVGTSTPIGELHVAANLGQPQILIEDVGASTWAMETNSNGLFFRDVGNGSNAPLFIWDTLPSSFFVIGDNFGNPHVGIGAAGTPDETLHIVDDDAKILVVSDAAATTGRTLFELQNNGNVQFFFQNTDSGDLWQMSQLSSVFQISSPSGSGKFRVRKGAGLQALNGSTTILDLNATGDLTVKSVTQTSSREEKLGFESVDGLSVLDKVAALPISEWSYKADNPSVRHIGPMSEDFHATFGLGKSDKGLTTVDTTGVALAAIQGLNQKLMAKNAELEQRLLELEELVQALAEH